MNVIVANEQQEKLANLDVDIIKNINGSFDASEIVSMFKNFFYSKMILDVTAMKQYKDLKSYEELIRGLEADKIIFVLPEGSSLCTPNFLSHLISIGIYNFTTNIKGIKYLLKKTNTKEDVEHISKMASNAVEKSIAKEDYSSEYDSNIKTSTRINQQRMIIGVKDVTISAGATTFIFMLKKELAMTYGSENVIAIEIDSSDFSFFNDKHMISIRESEIEKTLEKYSDASIILVDLNKCSDDSFCGDVLYLLEPTTIQLNKLVRRNKMIFSKLADKKVILNKSMLLNNDVLDFEKEAAIKVFYNMPALDERKRNAIINDFLSRLGLLSNDGKSNSNSNKIFGLFRR